MPDLNRMDRTWLCTVVFTDIAKYSSQSVELQMKLKARFNGYLAHAIRDTPEDERVILDTGDGAAICFLGAPEAAMFAALELWHSLLHDEREQQTPLRVRIGINLGPVKLVKDINGALNALGDGMNAGQRIMSFAAENQILVSQSFFEVVSRLSDDYRDLFRLKGVETDKHVREHTVYKLLPPGGERTQAFAVAANLEMKSTVVPVSPQAYTPPQSVPQKPPEKAQGSKAAGSRTIPLLLGALALVVITAAGVWYFLRPAAPASPAANPTPAPQQMTTTSPAAVPTATGPSAAGSTAAAPSNPTASPASPSAAPGKSAPTSRAPVVTASNPPAKQPPTAVATVAKENPPPPASTPPTPAAAPAAKPVTSDPNAAYAEGVRLLDQDKAAEAVRSFDEAIRAKPDFLEAYVSRAESRRRLRQFELSIEDCNKIIQIDPAEPRGYNCRGFGHQQLKQYDASLADFNEAIRRNPRFALAYANRGATYKLLQQWDRALADFNESIRLKPRDALFRIKRGNGYTDMKQYDNAIRDYTEAIRLQPNNAASYRLRATAEEAAGDAAGAAADRLRAKGLREK
jgi:class 3 adenylate cyclase/Tfp pilus assembly protein PilF